jgi:PIN domain nuclease of toxin-antitoxin system
MRLLLDTHILLWWLTNDQALPERADALIVDPANEVSISAISLWEVAIKARLGKLPADVDEVRAAALESDFTPLPFTLDHAAEVARLPDHHRDPFDRALVGQARFEPMRLITHDQIVAMYGDSVLFV